MPPTKTTDYGRFLNGPLPDLIDPRDLRGQITDGEIAARERRLAREAAAVESAAPPAPEPFDPTERNTRGLDAWTISVLEAVDAPMQGTGKNGAWTRDDFEALVV